MIDTGSSVITHFLYSEVFTVYNPLIGLAASVGVLAVMIAGIRYAAMPNTDTRAATVIRIRNIGLVLSIIACFINITLWTIQITTTDASLAAMLSDPASAASVTGDVTAAGDGLTLGLIDNASDGNGLGGGFSGGGGDGIGGGGGGAR
jgi:uncharacterized membrane protein YgcG